MHIQRDPNPGCLHWLSHNLIDSSKDFNVEGSHGTPNGLNVSNQSFQIWMTRKWLHWSCGPQGQDGDIQREVITLRIRAMPAPVKIV